MAHKFNADSRAKERCYIIPSFIRTKKAKKELKVYRKTTGRNLSEEDYKFKFQFNPTSIQYGRSANYANIQSPGMSYPLVQYTGGNIREFSVEVFYYDRPYSGKIDKARKFLLGLLPPENNNSYFTKPETFYFAYGYFVKKCVLKDLQINDEMLDENGRPVMTRFTLSCIQIKGN